MSDKTNYTPNKFLAVSQVLNQEQITYFSEKDSMYAVVKAMLQKVHYMDSGFFIVDISTIIEQYTKWIAELPRVIPFYAVKSNPNPIILKTLAILGTGFDCASKSEISQVLDIMSLELGYDQDYIANHIIYANPTKLDQHLRYARSVDVDLMTFDNRYELLKIAYINPDAQLVIRIKVDDSSSVCQFNSKFGVDLEDAEALIAYAQTLELNVVGVSFHVGSRCQDAVAFDRAIRDARHIFDMARKYSFHMHVLDLGGGFPGTQVTNGPQFEDFAKVINESLDKYFPDNSSEATDENASTAPPLKIIAEPGRYFCCASHTLVLNVIGKDKKVNRSTGEVTFRYTLNDGLYGSLNCIIFDHATPLLRPFNEHEGKTYKCIVYGPTCDSIDTLSKDCTLPDLAIGECVYYEECGAYSTASASRFNGFQLTPCEYIMRH